MKPLKVILAKRIVLIKQSLNFKRKYNDEKFKYKVISSLGCKYLWPNVVFFLYWFPSSSYSKDDLSFWQFWKLSILFGFSRNILEGERGFVTYTNAHVFLVGIYPRNAHSQECLVQIQGLVCCWRDERPNWRILLSFFYSFHGPLQGCLHLLNIEATKQLNTSSRNCFLKSRSLLLVSVFEAIWE